MIIVNMSTKKLQIYDEIIFVARVDVKDTNSKSLFNNEYIRFINDIEINTINKTITIKRFIPKNSITIINYDIVNIDNTMNYYGYKIIK